MSTLELDRRATGRPLTRRAVLGKAVSFGAAAVAVGVAGKLSPAGAQAVTLYKTTTALNFRSGPGTSYSVIAVIPAGTVVAHTGAIQNGFYEVGYNGTYGWTHRDYLAPVGSGPSQPADPVVVGNARTTSAVNLRSGPSTGHQVLRVVAADTWVGVSGTVQNGFRYVVHSGQAGWIFDQYLSWAIDGPSGEQPYDPNFATTTAALNLRAEASTGAKVLAVMPANARVRLLGGYANGFRQVSYNGTTGWAYAAYLN